MIGLTAVTETPSARLCYLKSKEKQKIHPSVREHAYSAAVRSVECMPRMEKKRKERRGSNPGFPEVEERNSSSCRGPGTVLVKACMEHV